ncbi:hypothetical protein [Campylobacter troglodytis]|uniref:hypothetical protein n=1 Tax=Campylobacter troglodytis TaxID=654363 RepID=UPI0011585376|nr:hypothetical protein [Campylobacter troglodytis]TQR60282.1 hypothetical protein DMC01_06485 [Campylobacter troglodytis]
MNINTSTNASLNLGLNQAQNSPQRSITVKEALQEVSLRSNELANSSELISYASDFGFRFNEEGSFEKELNRASNIPLSYDIKIKSVQDIAKELIRQDQYSHPSSIDLPALLNKYYSTLSAIEAEFSTEDNAYLSRNELLSLNQAFSTNDGSFDDEIIRIYKGSAQLNKTLSQNKNFNTLGLDNKLINFSFDKAMINTASNDFIKPYIAKDGSVSKSGLLMSFIYEDTKNQASKSFFVDYIQRGSSAHQSFYNMLRNEDSFEDFLRRENEERMSFDLYLYINGVSKQNSPDDKLMLFYQQYLSYQKDMDIKEFTNSSSIYRLYTQDLTKEFESIQNEFSLENDDLSKINETRREAFDNFYRQRKIRANLDRIKQSYLSVMS